MTSPDDWQSLYPFSSHHFSLDGVRMHYVDEGTGQPLLMVHGNPTWSFYWRNLIAAFRSTYRTVAVDHIGCGLSDKPQQYQYTLTQHTDNLVRLIRELDLQRITLIRARLGRSHRVGSCLGAARAFRWPGSA